MIFKLHHCIISAYRHIIKNYEKILVGVSCIALAYHFLLLIQVVLTRDFYIATDIARDFLLMDEIAQKGYVLVGPRSSAIGGLFHGPLWIYLSYPAYFLSHANPLVVSRIWMAWYILFLVLSYISISRLVRSRSIALISTALVASISFQHSFKMINPFGATTFMPLYLFTLYSTYTNKSIRWAILHLLVTGAMIQFQMAAGIPLLLVTITVWVYKTYRDKYLQRFFALPVLLIPLSTFLLFEIRHNFSQTRSTLNQLLGNDIYRIKMPFWDVFVDRFHGATQFGWQLLPEQYASLNIIMLILIVICLVLIHQKKNRTTLDQIAIFSTFVYGLFWIFSLLHNGNTQIFYYSPILILPILLFVISSSYINKICGIACVVLVLYVNSATNAQTVDDMSKRVGVEISSWKFYEKLSDDIFSDAPTEFGYFIYSPDIIAYQAKWAMQYGVLHHPEKKVGRYIKKNITYLVVEPSPKDMPEFTPDFWKIDKVKMEGTQIGKWCYPNKYCVEKWSLTDEQVAIPTDPNIDDWLHYR
ncbi:MAG: hypothetical protein WCO78_00870 [Candidatus Roizmanbacteria bacterium]